MISFTKRITVIITLGVYACSAQVSPDHTSISKAQDTQSLETQSLETQNLKTQKLETRWPGGAKAAFALTYDDSLGSHLNYVAPVLKKAGLKATFYLKIDDPGFTNHVEDWRALAAQGHELGNHTLYHPCQGKSKPGRDWVDDLANLDNYSVEQIAREVNLANEILRMVDGKTSRTIAYPCGDIMAGGESFLDAIKPFVTAGRSTEIITMDPDKVDRMYVPTQSGTERSSKELIAYAQSVLDSGGIGTFTFHGVGAEYLVVTRKDHSELIKWLKDKGDLVYVDTLENIMRRKAQYDKQK